MSDKKTILTPEQVVLSYPIAGVGYRFAAGIIDTLLQALMLLAVGVPVMLAGPWLRGDVVEYAAIVAIALTGLLVFAVFWGYYIYFETAWNGQTPGKRKLGLRVIRDTGHPVDFRAVVVRNIVRLADFLPGWYGVGIVSVFASRDSKRLGDFAAGTIVVREERDAPQEEGPTPVAPLPAESAPAAGPAAGRGDHDLELMAGVRRLSREDYLAVQHFIGRADELAEDVRAVMARRMAEPLMQKMGIAAPEEAGFSHERFLREAAAAYARAAGE